MATADEDSRLVKDYKRETVKILILGDFGIGKTTLIKAYLNEDCIIEDEENTFEEYRVRIKNNGNEVNVTFFDLSPGPLAPERRKCYPTDVNIILLCFSIAHYETLKSVYNLWIHEVRAHYGKLIPIFLVGLRSDFRFMSEMYPIYISTFHKEFHVVQKSEAEAIHKKYRFDGDYLECSRYDRSSIVEVINRATCAVCK